MSNTIKQHLGTTRRLGIAALACALFAECIVFRAILIPNDQVSNATERGVIRYAPHTTAQFHHPDGRSSQVTINDHGWNASKQRYRRSPPPGRTRIAVIGDSYVHGALVNPDQGFPEILERELNNRSTTPVDVIRFGMEGAPLSQYLHMLRQEVLLYRPDVVLVQLTHDDFAQSIYAADGNKSSRFMTMRRNNDATVTEIPPARAAASTTAILRKSATVRYVHDKISAYRRTRALAQPPIRVAVRGSKPKFISPATNIANVSDMDAIAFVTFHIMEKMHTLSKEHGFKLVFAMDGVREAIYAQANPDDYIAGKLNRIAANTAANLDVPFIDLQTPFAAHHGKERRRFEFSYNWHWNRLANHIAGTTIADHFLANPNLLRKRTAQSGHTYRSTTTQ